MGLNKPVEFSTAKLLKEKGFKQSTEANWWILAKDHSDNYMNGLPVDESKIFFTKDSCELESRIQIDENTEHNVFHYLVAPTIAEVVMWLYEKHDVWIYVIPAEDNKKVFKPFFRGENITDQHLTKFFGSPTDAYEAAITYCLENLIQGGNNEN